MSNLLARGYRWRSRWDFTSSSRWSGLASAHDGRFRGMWLRTRDSVYRILARRWARGAAILFAVGAVSGTALSSSWGCLAAFMKFAGPIIGLGFGLEGFAFFTEAIFLGIYIYGWDRVPPWLTGWPGSSSRQRRAVGRPRGLGQRLDEHAGRVHPARSDGDRHRPGAARSGARRRSPRRCT